MQLALRCKMVSEKFKSSEELDAWKTFLSPGAHCAIYAFVDHYNKNVGIVLKCSGIHLFFPVDLGGQLGRHL